MDEEPTRAAKRSRSWGSPMIESLRIGMHDFDTLDPLALQTDLRATGVACVRIYTPDDAVVLDYAAKVDETARSVRPDGGTAHGSRSMAGITKRWGAPAHPNIWEIRLDAKVRAVYEGLYGTRDLMIGCDAYACLRRDAARPSVRGPLSEDPTKKFHQQTGGKLKPHIDVHPTNAFSPGRVVERGLGHVSPDFPMAVQGQLVLRSVPRGGATLVVVPGGHALTEARHFECSSGRDFAVCTPSGYAHFDGRWRSVDPLDRGVLVLWASRLPHANKLADPGVDPERRGVFISWQPRALVPTQDREALKVQKWKAIKSGGSTDHWANFVPGQLGHRGGHYSNKNKLSKVLFDRDSEVRFPAELATRVLDAI